MRWVLAFAAFLAVTLSGVAPTGAVKYDGWARAEAFIAQSEAARSESRAKLHSRFIQLAQSPISAFPPGVFTSRAGAPAPCVYGGGSPTVTFRSTANSLNTGTANQSVSGVSIGSASPCRMAIIGYSVSGASRTPNAITVTPNVGNAQSVTIVQSQQAISASMGIGYAILDASADTATTITINVTYPSAVFSGSNWYVWTVPTTGLSSTTPTGGCVVATASTTSVNCNMATSSGGIGVSHGSSTNVTSNSGTISGTETWSNIGSLSQNTLQIIGGTANGLGANASNNVVVTYTQTGTSEVVAAAWR